MSIVLARLDNRLLHGIVATQWAPKSGCTRCMVIDDKTANTPMLKEAMKLGKPAGTALSIINKETAYGNFKNGKYEGQKVFVIANDPQIILDLIEAGNPVPKLILGGTASTDAENFEGTPITRRFFVKKSDEDVYRKIAASGTEIVAMFATDNTPEPLSKHISL